jgi:hypothetical protein
MLLRLTELVKRLVSIVAVEVVEQALLLLEL